MNRTERCLLSAILLLASSSITSLADRIDYHLIRGRQPTMPSQGIIEGEHLTLQGSSRVQNMAAFGPNWSGDSHLLWDGQVGEAMTTTFTTPHAGKFKLELQLTLAADYGIFSLVLNDRELRKEIDTYSSRVEIAPILDLGEIRLAEGTQTLTFTLTGANPQAKKYRDRGYLMGIDYLKLTALDPPKPTPFAKRPQNKGPSLPPERRPSAPDPKITFAQVQPIIEEFCVRCHDGKNAEGDIDLKKFRTKHDYLDDIQLAQKVSDALAYHEMPPADEQQVPDARHAQLLAFFESTIDEFLRSSESLEPTVMRRMNRYEYNNAVRDLLQLRGDLYPLPEKTIRAGSTYFNPKSGTMPPVVTVSNRALGKNQIERHLLSGVVPFAIDLPAEHGFNNQGEQLSVSPILLESFLKLARSIVHAPEFDQYSQLSQTFFRPPADATPQQLANTARERLAPFMERAFRSPVSEETLNRYLHYFEVDLTQTKSFTRSLKNLTSAILASPRFLYLNEEKSNTAKVQRIEPYELAARLAMFLWSSIPDNQLLESARSRKLLDPIELHNQVTRMLEDPRSQSLSHNFARQWLRLDQLITATPDFDRFETYYARIGCEQWKFGLQTMIEPLLLFESIMVEDRSIMLLIDANYTFRSDELQSWYTEEQPFSKRENRNRFNTFTQTFRRIPIKTRREGGVITSAAVLTMTSSPLRTNPITRGAWVATAIFNQPPPPPPDAIPEIEADDREIESKGLTLRQRLTEHQADRGCASCHAKIDPLGFALENYDAIGRWRDSYRTGLPIDSGGKLFGKVHFDGVVEFKDAILDHPDWFMRAFSEHLLAYALGRELTLTDKPAVDQILHRVASDHGQFSTVVHAITESYPFLHKTNQQRQPVP
ncbi:MAG: DUF1588 domain-containing protein [Planctomycetota bacterium]|nr:DUF1588 domain-containing protein [Planctomycetota bacterium]